MTAYRTAARIAEAELVVKKSRFIGRVAPAQTAEAAAAFVTIVRAAHHDAGHNAWAYNLRDGQQRYSDDGEPQGTAGQPILEALQKQGLEDCVAVVTRYFGGVLLGTGGLTRAYGQAASAAIEAAGIVTMEPCRILRAACGYDFYGALQRLAAAHGGAVMDARFADTVTVTLRLHIDAADAFAAQLAEKSNGRVRAEHVRDEFATNSPK